jgi:hypothetical protein
MLLVVSEKISHQRLSFLHQIAALVEIISLNVRVFTVLNILLLLMMSISNLLSMLQ